MIPAWVEFIAVWQRASSLNEVAEATGYTYNYCRGLAVKLRRKGFDLKRFVPASRFTSERAKSIQMTNCNRHRFTSSQASEAAKTMWECRAVERMCGGDR